MSGSSLCIRSEHLPIGNGSLSLGFLSVWLIPPSQGAAGFGFGSLSPGQGGEAWRTQPSRWKMGKKKESVFFYLVSPFFGSAL